MQTVDVSLKLLAELAAFCFINGVPRDNIGDVVKPLADYSGESLMTNYYEHTGTQTPVRRLIERAASEI